MYTYSFLCFFYFNYKFQNIKFSDIKILISKYLIAICKGEHYLFFFNDADINNNCPVKI